MSDEGAEDLVFGDVQQVASKPNTDSPVENTHLAHSLVVHRRSTTAPPTTVFVDLDAMLDMQEHAAEDTSVELGGILLGQRGVRKDGTPFVQICDSLRARHYRATRGSFTFTHETWADLNEQRSRLPSQTEIVGWYHTHPGWGVFLSDMDVFICDHFFAHADDVALVIDPTSGDTGLFVRRGTASDRAPGRLDQYALVAHRKRIDELNQWASYFSGAPNMHPSPAVFPGRGSAPVVIAAPPDGTANQRMAWMWLMAAVICGQFALMIVLAVQHLYPSAAEVAAEQKDRLGPEQKLIVREQIVDALLERIAADGAPGVLADYRQLQIDNAELRASQLGLMSHVTSLEQTKQKAVAQEKRTEVEIAAMRQKLVEAETKIQALKPADDIATPSWMKVDWWAFSTGGGLGIVLSALALAAWSKWNPPRPSTTDSSRVNRVTAE